MANEFNWDKIEPAKIDTPKDILYRFTNSFNEKVGESLIMEIKSLQRESVSFDDIFNLSSSGDVETPKQMVYKVVVRVPALENYVQHLLTISHPMNSFYPCTLEVPLAPAEEKEKKCNESGELITCLQEVASMQSVIATLANLLALIR